MQCCASSSIIDSFHYVLSLTFFCGYVCVCLYVIKYYFDYTGKFSAVSVDYDEKFSRPDASKQHTEKEFLPPPPPPKRNDYDAKEKVVNRVEEDDIFVGEGTDYEVPSKDMSQSPLSEDMEESPRGKERASYFEEPAYGPAVPPSQPSHDWQQTVSFSLYLI